MKSLKVLITTTLLFLSSFLYSQDCKIDCLTNLVIPATKGQEGAIVNFPTAATTGECGSFSYTPASGSFFRIGSHSIIAKATNGNKCSFTIVVTDNEAPELSTIRLSRSTLWPASNKMKKTKVFFKTSDNGGKVTTELFVKSNSTDKAKDWEIVDENELRLRSSRLTDGSPRIYTITVVATDEAGNKTKRTTTIAVSETMMAQKLP